MGARTASPRKKLIVRRANASRIEASRIKHVGTARADHNMRCKLAHARLCPPYGI
jgi:hypothetical protein